MLHLFKDKACKSKEDLTALVKDKPELVFETIFRAYYDKLFHIARTYLGTKEDAEEITQNVFLNLWSNIIHIGDINNLNHYLFTLTKNACFNHLKHRKVKSNYHSEKTVAVHTQYLQSDTESYVLENELRKKIDDAIADLPEKCRTIFVQSRFDGLKNRQIAKVHGISKRTVDNHISKGIRHLKLQLKEFTLFLL